MLLVLAVIGLIVVIVAAAQSARVALSGGYVISDIARMQRTIDRLYLATEEALRLPESDWGPVRELGQTGVVPDDDQRFDRVALRRDDLDDRSRLG